MNYRRVISLFCVGGVRTHSVSTVLSASGGFRPDPLRPGPARTRRWHRRGRHRRAARRGHYSRRRHSRAGGGPAWTRSSPAPPRRSRTSRTGASLAVGGFGLCGIPTRADPGAARRRRRRPRGRLEQLRRRRLGLGPAAADKRIRRMIVVVRRGEQGVRAAVPLRRARGRADPAGHAGRAAARRRLGHPGVLHRDRRRHPGRRRRPAVAVRRRRQRGASPRPPKETREFDVDGRATYVLEQAITTDFGLVRACEGRPARQPRLPRVRPQLQPAVPRWPGGSRSPRSRSWSSPASSTPTTSTCPGVFVQRVVAADPGAGRRQADREAHRAPARRQSLTWR